MNIHPIFVHFPIALLTLYSLCEFIRFKKFTNSETWLSIKIFLLFFGVVGAFVALETGGMAEKFHQGLGKVLTMHELYAKVTFFIFAFLLGNYLILLIDKYAGWRFSFWKIISSIRSAVFTGPVVFLIALMGLITLTITGALGGIIIYGSDVDPVASFVSKFLLGQ